jgi:hypothetical protein
VAWKEQVQNIEKGDKNEIDGVREVERRQIGEINEHRKRKMKLD